MLSPLTHGHPCGNTAEVVESLRHDATLRCGKTKFSRHCCEDSLGRVIWCTSTQWVCMQVQLVVWGSSSGIDCGSDAGGNWLGKKRAAVGAKGRTSSRLEISGRWFDMLRTDWSERHGSRSSHEA